MSHVGRYYFAQCETIYNAIRDSEEGGGKLVECEVFGVGLNRDDLDMLFDDCDPYWITPVPAENVDGRLVAFIGAMHCRWILRVAFSDFSRDPSLGS